MYASYAAWFLLVASGVQLGLVLTGLRRLDNLSAYSNGSSIIIIVVLAAIQAALAGLLLAERSRRLRLEAKNKAAAGTLQESDAQNSAILKALPDMMFLLSKDGTYLDWYAKDHSNLYPPPEQFLGKNVREIMPAGLAQRFADKLQLVRSSGEAATLEYSLMISGQERLFESRIVACGEGKLLSIVRDLSEKKQAEIELEQLSSRLLALQDNERRRLAVELHDITAQNLFAISINLENLRRQVTSLTATARETFDDCQHLCEQSLQEIRTLSYALHPPALDRLGLLPSLQWHIDGFCRRSGVDIRFIGAREVGRLPLEMETDIFRIVQEALSNVARHSGSRTASVHVRKRAGQFVLQIKDDGCGMQAGTRNQHGYGFGVGLPSIRQRVRRWGGHLDIQSEAGVLLSVELPIPGVEKVEPAVDPALHCTSGREK